MLPPRDNCTKRIDQSCPEACAPKQADLSPVLAVPLSPLHEGWMAEWLNFSEPELPHLESIDGSILAG